MFRAGLFFRGLRQGFKDFGEDVAAAVNFILLSIVYFFGVGATSIAAKISRRHFLGLKRSAGRKTYWVAEKIGKSGIDDYYRQF